jgi:hypothetical protein
MTLMSRGLEVVFQRDMVDGETPAAFATAAWEWPLLPSASRSRVTTS